MHNLGTWRGEFVGLVHFPSLGDGWSFLGKESRMEGRANR